MDVDAVELADALDALRDAAEGLRQLIEDVACSPTEASAEELHALATLAGHVADGLADLRERV